MSDLTEVGRKRKSAVRNVLGWSFTLLTVLFAFLLSGAQVSAQEPGFGVSVEGPGEAPVGDAVEIVFTSPSSAAAIEAVLSYDAEALEFGGVSFDHSMETLATTTPGMISVGAFRCADQLCDTGLQAPVGPMRVRFMVRQAGNHSVNIGGTAVGGADGAAVGEPFSDVLIISAGDGSETSGAPIDDLATDRQANPADNADVTGDNRVGGADLLEAADGWGRTRRSDAGPCQLDETTAGLDVDLSGCLDVVDLAAIAAATDGRRPAAGKDLQRANNDEVGANNLTFVVNSTGDASDANTNDDICRTSGGQCTLRAAIQQANSSTGPDRIHFNIPGSGVRNINLGSPLPGVYDTTGGTFIDGYTQPGSRVNTSETIFNGVINIQITGRGQSARQAGFRIYGPDNTVRGLAIYNSYTNMVISGNGARQNTIIGNIIGTNSATTWSASSSVQDQAGIELRSGASYNQIGTIDLADRNVISGNPYSGVRVNHADTTGNRIQNNMVGFNANATRDLFSYVAGVDVQWGAKETLIGGYQKFAGNVFARNRNYGVDLSHSSKNNYVVGNRIGTDPTGTRTTSFSGSLVNLAIKDNTVGNTIEHNVIGGGGKTGIWHRHNFTGPNTFRYNWVGIGLNGSNIGNPGYGMELSGHDDTYIGNIFANNGDDGVRITSFNGGNGFSPPQYTQSNRLSDNSFFNNNGPAISISGAHNNVAAPRINAASQGSASGTACGNCTVELYVSHQSEGRQFITSTQANSAGSWSISDPAINNVTLQALVISPNNDTSTFSSTRQVGSSGGNTAPSFAAMPNRSSAIDQWVQFSPSVSDPDGDYLTYHAIGLPQSVTIDRRTGDITGRAPAAGLYEVHVAVDDGNSFQVRSFEWLVSNTPTADVSGQVTDLSNDGVPGVLVDLFTEGRANWLASANTGADGRYQFDVNPGCYVVTFVAPNGAQFNSGQYQSQAVCVDGQNSPSVDAQLLINGNNNAPRIEAAVNNRSGAGVGGVKIDLFQSDQNANRISYLRSTTTDQSGNYSFTLNGSGCVILTFVAPTGETFVESGSPWLNRHVCLSDGQVETNVPATVNVGVGQNDATAGGAITDGGNPVGNVQVDLYKAGADGSRGSFEQLTQSGGDGRFSFTIAEAGCYTLTYIAPDGRTWTDTGSRWWNRTFCISAGQNISDLNAVLN